MGNVLSRLASRERSQQPDKSKEDPPETLHVIASENWALATSIMEISEGLRKRLLDGYEIDPPGKRILDVLCSNEAPKGGDAATLPFKRHGDELIHYADPDCGPRLCTPIHDVLIKNVFHLVHVDLGHPMV